MIQGEWINRIIGASDIVLLLELVDSLTSKSFAELWFPICLPQFDSSCFFHAYVQSLDNDLNAILIMVSSSGEMAQFNLFSRAASEVKERMGFLPKDNTTNDIQNTAASQFIEEVSLLTCTRTPLSLASILANKPRVSICKEVNEIESIVHFTFRFDSNWKGSDNRLAQCITSEAIENENLKLNVIWAMYRQLSLHLRLGSSSTDSFLLALNDLQNDGSRLYITPCLYLLESPINKSREVVIEFPDRALYVGLCGNSFELYATFVRGVNPSAGLILCRKVAHKLKKASQNLFLNKPKRFKTNYK